MVEEPARDQHHLFLWSLLDPSSEFGGAGYEGGGVESIFAFMDPPAVLDVVEVDVFRELGLQEVELGAGVAGSIAGFFSVG